MDNRNQAKTEKTFSIIGPAIMDVLAGPVSEEVFHLGTEPMDFSTLTFGGNALNEAVVLSRLGGRAELISVIGRDEAGDRILSFARENKIITSGLCAKDGLETSINIVLVNRAGERFFLTNPRGSMRRLSLPDIEPFVDGFAGIVCFAGMFISPQMDIPSMEELFGQIKSDGKRTLAVDLTTAKHGENLSDLAGLLPCIDYFFPNAEEARLLTGEDDPYKSVEALLKCGVSCTALKLGGRGCLLGVQDGIYKIPAYPVEKVIDTTGAGDCFAAGFLWGLAQEFTPVECTLFACAAASCSIEGVGAVSGITELEEPMRRYEKMRNAYFKEAIL